MRRGAAGFTLIELVVVLAILGLTASITAGLVVRPHTAAALSRASTRVASELRLARLRAMSESRLVLVGLTPDRHGMQLDRAVVDLGPSVTLATVGPETIAFAPDGSTSGGEVRLMVGTRQNLIRIDWLTGRVSQLGPLN